MPSAAHRVPACRRIHGRTRSLRTLSTRRRSPRHCQPDLVRDEFAASLTCTRHLRQADCSAPSPRDALLSHDLCPQLRAPLSHAETRSSSHTLLPLCSLTARRSPHPTPALSPTLTRHHLLTLSSERQILPGITQLLAWLQPAPLQRVLPQWKLLRHTMQM